MRERPWNLLLFFFGMVAAVVLAAWISKCIIWVINEADTSIWIRYASENKIESMFFLENDNEKTKQFFEKVYELDGVKEPYDKNKLLILCNVLLNHFETIREYGESDEDYSSYLQSKELSIDDFESFLKKFIGVQKVVLKAGFYIALLLYCFFVVCLLKMRKVIYIIAGVLYFVMAASFLTSGLTDYVFTILANIINFLGGQELSYTGAFDMRDIFLAAFKESMLTFIIFDTVIQIIETEKKYKVKYCIDYFIGSIISQREYLMEYVRFDRKYIGKLKVPYRYIDKELSKQISHWNKKSDDKKKKSGDYYRYKDKLKICQELKKNVNSLVQNGEAHENRYYIDLMRSTEILLARAYANKIIGC